MADTKVFRYGLKQYPKLGFARVTVVIERETVYPFGYDPDDDISGRGVAWGLYITTWEVNGVDVLTAHFPSYPSKQFLESYPRYALASHKGIISKNEFLVDIKPERFLCEAFKVANQP